MVEIKCDTCLGCNRLEMPEFNGVYRCENYVDGRKEEKNNIIERKGSIGSTGK